MMLVDDPSLAHAILEFLTEIVIDFSLAQLESGVAGIGAGDAATSLVSAAHYREFALPYEQRVVNAVHEAGGLVKLHICGTTTHLLNDMVQSGADLFNVDHLVRFRSGLRRVWKRGQVLQGQPGSGCRHDAVDPAGVRGTLSGTYATGERIALHAESGVRSAWRHR